MKRLTAVFLLFAAFAALFACSAAEEDGKSGVSVVTTLFPQYDFARAVVGEKGSVRLLLPPGADSHSFEIKPSDMEAINRADIFIYMGPKMEIWVNNVIGSIDEKVKIVNLSENISLEYRDAEGHTRSDPHIWTSPVNARKILQTVCEAVCAVDPDNAVYYRANYEAYDAKLKGLDAEFSGIARSAGTKSLYFSGRFAFAHFAAEYGFVCKAPFNSCSDIHAESVAAINALVDDMKRNGARYVFYAELSDDAILDTITAETGAKPLLLHSAHNLSKADFDAGVSYISLMEANAKNLKKAVCDG